ncbi:MAG: hypothetical protein ACRCTZ_06665 [Sarcina sp.]
MQRLKENKIAFYSILISFMFLTYIGSVFIGSTLLFVIHVSMTKFNFFVFPIIAMFIAKYLLDKDNSGVTWKFMIFSIIFFFVSAGLLAWANNTIWDYSYDSMAYHQEAVIAIKNGWNPFYQSKIPMNLWVMHYAKAAPIFAASIFKITNRIESAKILSSFLPLILLVLSFGTFYLITKKRKILSGFAALLLILNPVILGQSFTYYVDSMLGIYVIFLIINVVLILFYKDLTLFKYLTLVNIAVFLSNIKFTGLAYAGVILLAFLICSFFFNEKKYNIRLLIFLVCSLVITVGVIGFNPYVTNTINDGNPLYPLAGKGKINIMTNNTPLDYRYDGQFEQFYKSMIAVPSTKNPNGKPTNSLAQLFEINGNVLTFYAGVDARMRGFGIYSILFLPLSFIGLLYLLATCRNKKVLTYSILTLVFIMGTLLAAGAFWWARYINFIWLIPVGVGTFMVLKKSKISKIIGMLLLILLFVNSAILIPTMISYKIRESNGVKAYVFSKPLVIYQNNFEPSFINKAKEFDLKYTIVK